MNTKPENHAPGTMKTSSFIIEAMTAHGRTMALVMGLTLLAGIAEMAGISVLLPLVTIAIGTTEEFSGAAGKIVSIIEWLEIRPELAPMLTLVVVTITAKSVITLIATAFVGIIHSTVTANMRRRLINAVTNARWSYFSSQSTGKLTDLLSSQVMFAANTIKSTATLFSEVLNFGLYLILALMVSWAAVIAGAMAGLILMLVFGRLVGISRRAGARRTTAMQTLASRLNDGIGSFKSIKAMAAEGRVSDLLMGETQEINIAQRSLAFVAAVNKSMYEPIIMLFLAVGMYYAIEVLNIKIEEIMFMAILFTRTAGRANNIQSAYRSLASQQVAFEEFNKACQRAESEREPEVSGNEISFKDCIRFDNVCFLYDETKVLSGIDLTIDQGQFVTLIGGSGAGKTTLVDLIVGLNKASEGEIYVDDTPFSAIDMKMWRSRIGYVSQDNDLLHESIYINVTMERPGIDAQDVEDALRSAGIWEFVSTLPDGLNTIVGERGSKLSGGQRQRICLARALAGRPNLLILDEPTAALDQQTEADICNTLIALKGGVTTLAISHQPALAKAADKVYSIEKGQIYLVSENVGAQASGASIS